MRLTLTALAALALAACHIDRRTIWHQYRPTPAEGLSQLATLLFPLPPIAEPPAAARIIGLRLLPTYPYASLWAVAELTNGSTTLRRDTVEHLAVTSTGMPLGTGITLQQAEQQACPISLPASDSLCLRVYHAMRREVLPGIADVGIKLIRHEASPHPMSAGNRRAGTPR